MMMMRKILFLLLVCTFSGVATAKANTQKHYEAFFAALQAEFALQTGNFKEAYQGYLFILRTEPSQLAARRLLEVAWVAKNKQWQGKALEEVLKFTPDDVSAHQHYLLYLANTDQEEKAETQLKKLFAALEKVHTDADKSYRALAIALSQTKKPKLATRLMHAAVADQPQTVPILNALALFYRLLEDYPSAQKYIEKAYAKQPEQENTLLLYADILYLQDKKSTAIEVLTKSAGLSPKLDKTLVSMYMGTKQYQKAAEVYQRLIKSDSIQKHKWRVGLGTAYILAGKPDQAMEAFDAIVADKDSSQKNLNHAYYSLGLAYEEKEEVAQAIAQYDKVKDGEYALPAKVRQASLLAKEDKQAALMVLDNVSLSDLEDYNTLLLARINVYETHEEWEKVYALYTEAIETGPEGVDDFYYARALVAEKMGDIALMEKDLLWLIEKDANSYEALNALGYSLTVHTTRHEEALNYIQRALALKPNEFYILDSMGWVLHKLGKQDEALRYLQQAFDAKQDAEIAAHLAIVYASKGEKQTAMEYLQQALLLNGDNPAVKKAQELLQP